MLPQLEAHVGNVQNNTIDEIWNGAAIKILRDALAAYEFGPGCEFCEFRTTEANFSNTAMSRFDHFDVESENPTWPQQFEFSFSNSCNLECIMCTGLYSSAIRARREKLPPQPKMYPDDFVDSLRKYLPHLRLMKFLGGEPFLIKEHYRIWEMMIEDGLSVHCHVTTNGTQYNKRIARIMDRVPMAFSISLDGTSRKTLESIRVNANYDEVMENTARFRSYAQDIIWINVLPNAAELARVWRLLFNG